MKIFKTILSILSTILFGVFLILVVCVFCISNFASKDNIVTSMKQTDLLTEVKKIKNSGEVNNESNITKAIDEVYSLANQFSVSEDVVDKIIDSKATKEVIGMAVGNLTDYVVNGKNSKVLSENDIYDLVNDNLDTILNASDIKIDDGQKEKFLREVEKQLPDIVLVIPTSEDILGNDYGDKILMLQTVFSDKSKIICVCGLIISGLCVIILNKGVFNLFIAGIFSGLILIGISLLIPNFIVMAMDKVDLSLFASSLTNVLTRQIFYIGLSLVIFSTVILVIWRCLNERNGSNG